jgi:hypothetical protein
VLVVVGLVVVLLLHRQHHSGPETPDRWRCTLHRLTQPGSGRRGMLPCCRRERPWLRWPGGQAASGEGKAARLAARNPALLWHSRNRMAAHIAGCKHAVPLQLCLQWPGTSHPYNCSNCIDCTWPLHQCGQLGDRCRGMLRCTAAASKWPTGLHLQLCVCCEPA